ncbi:SDR family oxidoreductase [Mucilaginibacter sabulilitoris]|uniref:SDR family oxidoreductase n=1 Tax=Mucilaginibacter sabulilitoris TaxID=1173583 RepID=A0ABZ0TTG1_9SPHI|nr:SDR family oxidoreductase [Mucilaginibacter sabulilitoris]WPU96271.1 SDR family oxidoreductase [Mucilaginibacter sabulilitoris]
MSQFDPFIAHVQKKIALSDEELTELIAAFTPVKRLGRPEEIAAAALYLASVDSAFMISAELLLDGSIRSL